MGNRIERVVRDSRHINSEYTVCTPRILYVAGNIFHNTVVLPFVKVSFIFKLQVDLFL